MSGKRNAPIAKVGAEFKELGYRLVDQIAGFIDNMCGVQTQPGKKHVKGETSPDKAKWPEQAPQKSA